MALSLLLTVFFFIYYIFLMGMDKIRSLDTVYHLARIQEVRQGEAHFLARAPLAILQCFGRPGIPQIHAISGSATPISEVSFQFLHNFSSLSPLPHKSTMRVVQPNPNYLTKSYPYASEDVGGTTLLAQLGADEGALIALSHGNKDSLVDAGEDVLAAIEADKQ